MEHLRFVLDGGLPAAVRLKHALVGVVASGNLEVMIEYVPLDGCMQVEIHTAVSGFGTTWQAVLDDFHARHPLGDVVVSINDVGATPAVVSLRLDQAVEVFEERRA